MDGMMSENTGVRPCTDKFQQMALAIQVLLEEMGRHHNKRQQVLRWIQQMPNIQSTGSVIEQRARRRGGRRRALLSLSEELAIQTVMEVYVRKGWSFTVRDIMILISLCFPGVEANARWTRELLVRQGWSIPWGTDSPIRPRL